MTDLFAVHDVDWTPERLQRFWAFFAESAGAERAYFSSHSGDAIIAFASRHVPLSTAGRVLDYGCGPGFLLTRLLARGVQAEGLEFSTATRQKALDRCAGSPRFGGITHAERLPSPVPSDSIDVVFLIEVLEHLLPQQVDATLDDVARILRPGGHLVLTTPHNEDIESSRTICPDCGCVFHPWQHVGSYTTRSLADLVSRHDLQPIVCRATTLGGTAAGRTVRALRRIAGRMIGGDGSAGAEPHLVCIARKPSR